MEPFSLISQQAGGGVVHSPRAQYNPRRQEVTREPDHPMPQPRELLTSLRQTPGLRWVDAGVGADLHYGTLSEEGRNLSNGFALQKHPL